MLDYDKPGTAAATVQLLTPVHTPPASPCMKIHADPDQLTATFQFEKLLPELRCMVFNHLREGDIQAVHACRLVSRRFEAWATPTAYKTIEANELLLDLLENVSRRPLYIKPILKTYTRHVVVRSDLDTERVQRLLRLIPNLKSLRWRYVGHSLDGGNFWPPQSILRFVHKDTKLMVDDIPLRTPSVLPFEEYVGDIPVSSLTSVTMASGLQPFNTWLSPLKRILVHASNLETFRYNEHGLGTHFTFEEGERLPPIKHLSLKYYYWNHSPEEARKHWDFSRVQTLRLNSVPIQSFLSSVPMEDLANVHTLQIEDRTVYMDNEWARATDLMATLIGKHIRALTHLDITCDLRRLPIDVILKHGKSLRSLRIRDYTGFEDDDDVLCPTLPVSDVAALAAGLPHLRSLELDMDTALCDRRKFLQAIADFENLQTLTVHTQAINDHLPCASLVSSSHEVLSGYISDAPSDDLAIVTAVGLVKTLVAKRLEHGKSDDGQNRPSLLQRATINMGGWRPVMLRRVATAWKEKNQNGIFAERCFILEREPLKPLFTITEQVALEPNLSAVPPPPSNADRFLKSPMIIGAGVC